MFQSLKSRRSNKASQTPVSRRKAKRRQAGPPVFEPLPSRMMMSATLPVAHPEFALNHVGTATPQITSSATPVGLKPAQVRHAYGVDNIRFTNLSNQVFVGDGTGQTIAIVDAFNDPTAAADLHTFDVAMGLQDPPSFRQLNQTGGTTLPGTDPDASTTTGSWELEESLDIQWAHAIAPRANIVLIEANSNSFADLFTAVDTARHLPGVSAVSMSFGGSEFAQNDNIFTTPTGHSGVTFFASSGDRGAFNGPNHTVGVSSPAASPNVVAVGGTSLTTDANGTYLGESAWSGSGGGISTLEAEPVYQRNLVHNTGNKRGVPDVSWLADPNTGVAIVDSFDFGSSAPFVKIGGTSLSSPMWAGLMAVVNQGRVMRGKTAMDGRTQLLPSLYKIAAGEYHDITTGTNGNFNAGTGYDLVTGRGTPRADRIANDLVGGTISGTVFLDVDGNHRLDTFNNPVLSGKTVFIDNNNNGVLDAGEQSTVTDSQGHYRFSDVVLGSFVVRVRSDSSVTSEGPLTVTLTASSPNAINRDLGMLPSFLNIP